MRKRKKNNKYFLNLEKSRKAKNYIRKLLNNEGQEIINSKAIRSLHSKDPDIVTNSHVYLIIDHYYVTLVTLLRFRLYRTHLDFST